MDGSTNGRLTDGETMRTVLEGAAELSGVDGQLQGESHAERVDLRVVGELGLIAVLLGETELLALCIVLLSVGTVPSLVVAGGDVVSETQSTLLVQVVGHGPRVVVHLTVEAVAEVVVTRPRGLQALRRRNVERTLLGEVVAVQLTGGAGGELWQAILLVEDAGGRVLRGHAGAVHADALALYVLTLLLVVLAALGLVGEDHDIAPDGLVPVGIVVTLLRAFETAAGTGRILTSELRRVAVEVLRRGEETLVARASFALLVAGQVLVDTVHQVVGVIFRHTSGDHSVTDPVFTGVLEDQLAVSLMVGTTGMLIGPLQEHLLSSIVHLVLYIYTTTVVVL
mmetsp:Transcript_18127/g.54475  ORF Transcript_18127/g.54475 Transcript_18127/m.54475 type:complete len:339 (+) Transcript_18127:614-1630(+)